MEWGSRVRSLALTFGFKAEMAFERLRSNRKPVLFDLSGPSAAAIVASATARDRESRKAGAAGPMDATIVSCATTGSPACKPIRLSLPAMVAETT